MKIKTNMSLKELGIEFKKTKSPEVFNQLYEKITPGLRIFVNKILRDYDETEDIVSNTMCTVYEKIDMYDETWHISTWIYRIAQNNTYGLLRDRGKVQEIKLNEIETYDNNTYSKLEFDYMSSNDDILVLMEDEIEKQKSLNDIKDILNNLPKQFKYIMIDRYYKEMKYKDMAVKYDLPIQTIKNRIFNAKKFIKNNYEIPII